MAAGVCRQLVSHWLGLKRGGGRGAYRSDDDAIARLDRDVGAVLGAAGEDVGGGGVEVQLGGARQAHGLEGVAQQEGVGLLGRGLRGEGLDCLEVGRASGGEVEVDCFGELEGSC